MHHRQDVYPSDVGKVLADSYCLPTSDAGSSTRDVFFVRLDTSNEPPTKTLLMYFCSLTNSGPKMLVNIWVEVSMIAAAVCYWLTVSNV